MDRAARRASERLGRRAETLCALMLRLKGYAVLERRLRTPVGEIDIVARRGGILAFVEVKARADLVGATESLGPRQRRRVERGGEWMLARRPDLADLRLRFDLMVVSPRRLPRHIPDAWRPEA